MASSNLARYGEFFLKQGRPEFPLKGCVILCVATYQATPSEVAWRVTTLRKSYPLPIHAEESILRKIEKTEKESHSKAILIEFYASYSPCNKCCKLIEEFLRRRPRCEFSIAFTCVYRHDAEQNRSALRGLNRHGSVSKLDVFRRKEWSILQDNGLLALTRKERKKMEKWDSYWRQKLEEIMTADKVESRELQMSTLGAADIRQFVSQCCDDLQTYGAPQFEDTAGDYEEECFLSLFVSQCCDDLQTDGAPQFEDTAGDYEEECFLSLAELEEMEKIVREAMRRREQEERRNLMVCGTLIIIPLCLLGFLITRYVL